MLLCDAAQTAEGKLYMLGGGWTMSSVAPGQPVPMALAVMISIPWSLANHRFRVHVRLMTDEGAPVDVGGGPIEAQTGLEVGRPPGLDPGTSLMAPLAINVGALLIPPGRYVWQLEIDGDPYARSPFEVRYAR